MLIFKQIFNLCVDLSHLYYILAPDDYVVLDVALDLPLDVLAYRDYYLLCARSMCLLLLCKIHKQHSTSHGIGKDCYTCCNREEIRL